ncbi:hypothetical protein [Nocardia sp. NPDC058497]|uniref:hypothetical protein n=1 Tax=Nocardia sp. NPDC058497 TaxID=3346529 RepID=UPI00364894DE
MPRGARSGVVSQRSTNEFIPSQRRIKACLNCLDGMGARESFYGPIANHTYFAGLAAIHLAVDFVAARSKTISDGTAKIKGKGVVCVDSDDGEPG